VLVNKKRELQGNYVVQFSAEGRVAKKTELTCSSKRYEDNQMNKA